MLMSLCVKTSDIVLPSFVFFSPQFFECFMIKVAMFLWITLYLIVSLSAFLQMQGLPGRPGEKGSPGEPVSTCIAAISSYRNMVSSSPDVQYVTYIVGYKRSIMMNLKKHNLSSKIRGRLIKDELRAAQTNILSKISAHCLSLHVSILDLPQVYRARTDRANETHLKWRQRSQWPTPESH